MLSSIRIRLTLSHLLVIILAMGLSGFLSLSFLERYFLRVTEEGLTTQGIIAVQALIPGATVNTPTDVPVNQREQLRSAYNTLNSVRQQEANNLSLQTENYLPPPNIILADNIDFAYLSDISLQFNTQLETRIRILDVDRVVLVDSWQMDQGTKLETDILLKQALSGQYASHTDPIDNDATMALAFPALIDNQLVGVVYLNQPLRDVISVLRDLRILWLLATGIALFLSGGVGFFLSRAIARPVRRLTSAAGAVAQGDFEQVVPVRSQDELGHLSNAFNDMTSRLQAARQMQVNFVANVSHELRTPLTSIKGMIETLQDGAVEDMSVRDRFLKTVEDETDRLIHLVNDLLLLSRVDSEALNLHREASDLMPLIETTIDRLSHQANEKLLAFEVKAGPDIPLIWGDTDRIKQVLMNLLDNAIKYSYPSGLVTIKINCRAQAQLLVQIGDGGIGIPPKDLPNIGQRFYRTDKARSRTEGGSGLGLAIARALIQAHGGELWLESQEGKGTTVSFTLPCETKHQY